MPDDRTAAAASAPRRALAPVTALLLVLAAPPSVARAGDAELGGLLDRLRMASDASTRDALKAKILKTRPRARSLIKAIREDTTFSTPKSRGVIKLDIAGIPDPVDGFIPESYDPGRATPLLIGLHGMGGKGEQVARPAAELCREEGWLLLCPTLREADLKSAMASAGKTGFGWGDHRDAPALLCLRWALRHWRVDPDRVMLLGVSLGGYGTWSAGTHHWPRFAAMMPYAGGIDYRENLEATAKLIPKSGVPKGFMGGVGAQSGEGRRRDLLQNLKTLPTFFVHGARDRIVEPYGDRLSARELKKLGYKHCVYREEPDWGHMPPKDEIPKLVAELLNFAKSKRRDPDPAHVVHFAPREDTDDLGIARLVDFDEGARFEMVRKGRTLTIKTEGVRAFELEFPLSRCKTHQISINGRRGRLRARASAEAVLESYLRRLDTSRLHAARELVRVP